LINKEIFASIQKLIKLLTIRFDRRQLESSESLSVFIHTRAAYIAQTSLFGYLKARMGTQFRVLFEDDVFSESIQIASVQVFLSCLSDLTVYCVASVARSSDLSNPDAEALARHCFETACREALKDVKTDRKPEDPYSAFTQRISGLDWHAVPDGEAAFARSEGDLIRFAPVIDDYKELDEEIVSNSIRFRWHDVRTQARKRVNGAAIAADWGTRSA